MSKIIRLDTSQKKFKDKDAGTKVSCTHKHVIAYTFYREVRCQLCGAVLDPFDVLVDLLKGYVPPDDKNREERMLREVEKRKK